MSGGAWDLHLEPAPRWRFCGPLAMWLRDDGVALVDAEVAPGRYGFVVSTGEGAPWIAVPDLPRVGQMNGFDAPFLALDERVINNQGASMETESKAVPSGDIATLRSVLARQYAHDALCAYAKPGDAPTEEQIAALAGRFEEAIKDAVQA